VRTSISRISALGVALLAALGLAACGGGGHDSPTALVVAPGAVVARVGDTAITGATLSHWMSVLNQEAATHGSSSSLALQRQALSFLLSAQWLIGEAADRGQPVSAGEVDRRFQQRSRESFPGGESELDEFLKGTGQTVADLKLKIGVELASARMQHALTSGEPGVSAAQIAAYYRQNIQRFTIHERRDVELVEVKTEAAAKNAKREIEAGKSIADMSPYRETIERYSGVGGPAAPRIEAAIFSAKPNVLTGPLKLHYVYSVFVFRRAMPPVRKPLAEVEASIRAQLLAEQRQRTIAQFADALASRWTPQTDCQPGFVVRQCRQYKGPQPSTPEDPFSID
jgi:hypothetical protein